jgi:hypothetical protein
MMNINDLENALMSTIVDYISDQVILRYTQTCKRAVVLFTGGVIGYGEAVNSLKALKEDGWKFNVVLSRAASEVLTKERIENDIDPEAIYVEGAPVDGRQLVRDAQYVIVPVLTINTAAKLANCIYDNLITNMIFNAMTSGKPVIAAIDACCPDNKVREKIGFNITDKHKAKLRSNLVELVTYGMNLTTAENLAGKIDKVFCSDFGLVFDDPYEDDPFDEDAPACRCAKSCAPAPAEVRIDKKVVGRTDIMEHAGSSIIIVNKDAIVTGLAKDEASTRCIKIIQE